MSKEQEVVEEFQLQEKITNEEFKIWKKTVPLLYDTIRSITLEKPALSFRWLDTTQANALTLRYVVATGSELKVGSVDVPATLSDTPPESVNPATDSSNFKFTLQKDVDISCLATHKTRVAGFRNDGTISVYDIGDAINHYADLSHHTKGTVLRWANDNQLISAGDSIALWDVKEKTPVVLPGHSAPVNDVTLKRDIVGSVADDRNTQFADIRAPSEPAIVVENAHIQNAISFHPFIETMYATAGKDNVVSLYDLRNPHKPFRSLFGHSETVSGLRWDPHDPNQLVSWGLDKRVNVWDVSRLGEDYTYPSADESRRKNKQDPCLKFVHAGHTKRVNDVDLNGDVRGVYATVGEDNLLEVWKMKVVGEGEEEEEEEEE